MPKKEYTYQDTRIACYRGYITQAIINNLAPLLFIIFQNSYRITYDRLGQLILVNFATQLLTDIWATKYADRFGYRKCMIAAHALSAIGLIGLGSLPRILPTPYPGLILSVIIYAIGGGLLEVIVSPIVEALPSNHKEGSMSLLHSFYCWGQMSVVIISTLVLKLLGRDLWFLLPLMWSLFPLYNLFRFLHVPILPLVKEGTGMKLKELLACPSFYLSMLLMVCSGASELTMSQWSSIFAEQGLLVSKLVGDILGPGLFALFMAIGRTIYGYFGERLKMKQCLIACSILCIFSYLVTALSLNPFLSLLTCGLCGFSVSLMWPGTFSLTSAAFPRGGTLLFGLLAIGGDLGCSFGPWVAGKVSDYVQETGQSISLFMNKGLNLDQIGLYSGILVGTVFPIIMFLGLIIFRKNKMK